MKDDVWNYDTFKTCYVQVETGKQPMKKRYHIYMDEVHLVTKLMKEVREGKRFAGDPAGRLVNDLKRLFYKRLIENIEDI